MGCGLTEGYPPRLPSGSHSLPTEGIVRDRKIVTEEHHADLKASEGTGIATTLEVPSAAIQKYTSVTPTGSPLGIILNGHGWSDDRSVPEWKTANRDWARSYFFSFGSLSFGSSFCSHPVTISRLGKAFFNLLTPPSVTFVCHRYRLFNLESPASSSNPRSVISVP